LCSPPEEKIFPKNVDKPIPPKGEISKKRMHLDIRFRSFVKTFDVNYNDVIEACTNLMMESPRLKYKSISSANPKSESESYISCLNTYGITKEEIDYLANLERTRRCMNNHEYINLKKDYLRYFGEIISFPFD
jgi:hypothetical protein